MEYQRKYIGKKSKKFDCYDISEVELTEKVFADTETSGLDSRGDRVISLQIANQAGKSYNIELQDFSHESIQELLETENVTWVFHNAVFDYNMLRRYLDKDITVHCTQVAEKMLCQGIRKSGFSLKNLLYEYCDIQISKDVRSSFINHQGRMTDEQILYGFNDVENLEIIYNKQRDKISKWEMEESYLLEMETIKCIADMTFYGIKLDLEKWTALSKEALKEKDAYAKKLDNWIKDNLPEYYNKFFTGAIDMFTEARQSGINYGSSTQMLKLFEQIIKLKKVENKYQLKEEEIAKKKVRYGLKDKDGNITASSKAYKKNFPNCEFAKLFSQYAFYDKRASTYGANWKEHINPNTGKIHTRYNQIITTSRLSSNSPNLQNIPADNKYRNCFYVEKGKTLISADYSGQESKITAHLSKDENLISFYLEKKHGGDLHSYVAEFMHGVPVPPKLEDDEEAMEIFNNSPNKHLRNEVKPLNFSIDYGASPKSIAMELQISEDEATRLYNKYLNAFPGKKQYFQDCKDNMWEKGYILVDSKTGRKVFIPDFESLKAKRHTKSFEVGEWERFSINYPTQGTAALMVKLALCYIRREFYSRYNIKPKETNPVAALVLQVHDEIEVTVDENIEDQACEIIEDCMKKAAYYFVDSVGSMRPKAFKQKRWNK